MQRPVNEIGCVYGLSHHTLAFCELLLNKAAAEA